MNHHISHLQTLFEAYSMIPLTVHETAVFSSLLIYMYRNQSRFPDCHSRQPHKSPRFSNPWYKIVFVIIINYHTFRRVIKIQKRPRDSNLYDITVDAVICVGIIILTVRISVPCFNIPTFSRGFSFKRKLFNTATCSGSNMKCIGIIFQRQHQFLSFFINIGNCRTFVFDRNRITAKSESSWTNSLLPFSALIWSKNPPGWQSLSFLYRLFLRLAKHPVQG